MTNKASGFIIIIIRLLIKIAGLYYLIYFSRPANEITLYTILVGVAEIYEFGAIFLANKNPKKINIIYSIVSVLNALLFVSVIYLAEQTGASMIMFGFIIIIASAIPAGLWPGLISGLCISAFFMFGSLFIKTDPTVMEKIPFYIAIGLLAGIMAEGRISALKEKEEALEKSTRQKEVNRLKNEFIAIASHNLRTPITVIKGALDLLSTQNKQMNEGERENMYENIGVNVTRLNRMTEDLLSISSLESEEYKLYTTQSNIETVIDRVINEMNLMAKGKKIDIIFNRPEKPLPPIQIDSEKMFEALSNLVSNGIKFSHENSRVTINTLREGSQVIVSVKDEGIGISPEEQKNLFQKFHRATSVMTYDYEGVGLGLYITKLIIEAHGGKIWLESESNKGTTFFVSIPLATVEKLVENL